MQFVWYTPLDTCKCVYIYHVAYYGDPVLAPKLSSSSAFWQSTFHKLMDIYCSVLGQFDWLVYLNQNLKTRWDRGAQIGNNHPTFHESMHYNNCAGFIGLPRYSAYFWQNRTTTAFLLFERTLKSLNSSESGTWIIEMTTWTSLTGTI